MSTTHPGGCPSSQRNECGTKTCYGGYESCQCTGWGYSYSGCKSAADCLPIPEGYGSAGCNSNSGECIYSYLYDC